MEEALLFLPISIVAVIMGSQRGIDQQESVADLSENLVLMRDISIHATSTLVAKHLCENTFYETIWIDNRPIANKKIRIANLFILQSRKNMMF